MNVSSIFRSSLNVLTQPSEETFEQERQSANATFSTAMIWIAIAAIIAAILGVVNFMLGRGSMNAFLPMLEQLDLPPETRIIFEKVMQQQLSPTSLITSFISTIMGVPIFFIIGVGVTHLLAKMFGGKGSFSRTAYLQSLFTAPFVILNSIPLIGGCLAVITFIYSIILWFYSTKVEYELTTGKTIGIALVALLVIVLFFACILVLASSVLVLRPAVHEVEQRSISVWGQFMMPALNATDRYYV